MAQVLLERMLARHGVDGAIRVRSGGIANYARDGMIASLDARLALRDEGIHLGENDFVSTDLRRHRDQLARADLILTMTVLQKQMLFAFDEIRDRPVFTLREFVGEEGDITIRRPRAWTSFAPAGTRSSAAWKNRSRGC
jgi:protein-tyrosine-phosphatase